MSVTFSKLLSVLMQVILAAPTIAAAVKPVLDEVKKPAATAASADAEPAAA